MNSCHVGLHSDTLLDKSFSAMLRMWKVSAFAIQPYWRASPRARGRSFQKQNIERKEKEKGTKRKKYEKYGNEIERLSDILSRYRSRSKIAIC